MLSLIAWAPLAVSHAAVPAGTSSARGDTTPLELVLARVEPGSAEADPSLVQEVRLLGGESIPMWVAILESGSIEAAGGDRIPVSDAHARTVRAALRRLPAAVVVERVEDAVRPASPERVRGFAIELYGEIGGATKLPYVASLASEGLEAPFESTLSAILARDEGSFSYLDSMTRSLPGALLPALIRSIGGNGSPFGLLPLTRLLGSDPEVDVLVLEAMPRLRDPSAAPAGLAPRVRSYLERSDEELVATALGVLAFLDDHDSVERAIELLSDEHLAVRRSALGALREMTSLSFPLDARRWECWYAGEVTWWETRSGEVFSKLRDSDPAIVLQGIGEVVPRRLHRAALTDELLPLLTDADPTIRRIACQALGQIGCRVAIPDLEARLNDRDEEVRGGADRALRSLGWSPDPR